MRFHQKVLCLLSLVAVLALGPGCTSARAATGVVSCAQFNATLRDTINNPKSPFRAVMQQYSSTFTNTANGQTFRFLAVRPSNPNAAAYETLAFFNGTSQITPDWPIGMLINGTSTLCDNFALVFTDYPGIGNTTQPQDTAFTFDHISHNMFNLLGHLNDNHGFKIRSINPTGWSLGTESAMKFSALATWNSGFSGRGMKINKLFLIATKSGGDLKSTTETTPLSCSSSPTVTAAQTYYPAIGNQAMCVTSILNRMVELSGTLEWAAAVSIKKSMVTVLFPYSDSAGNTQSPYGTFDPSTVCAATVDNTLNKVSAMCDLQDNESVTACGGTATACSDAQSLYEANRAEPPYFDDISYAQFAAQRRLNFTYDYGHCREASTTSWTSRNCSFNPSETSSSLYNSALIVNGSPCTTVETAPDGPPYVVDCPQFAARLGGVVIFNGEQDMFIRHDYANALCDWFNRTGMAPCTVNTYPNAGHGVPFNYGSSIFNVINGSLPRLR
jgi:hypothetical protein